MGCAVARSRERWTSDFPLQGWFCLQLVDVSVCFCFGAISLSSGVICFDFNSSQAQLLVATVGSRNYTLPRQSLLGFSSHILLLEPDPYLGLARICANASFPRRPAVLCSDIVPSTLPDTALYPSKWEEGCYCCRMRYIKRMCSARQDDSTLVRKRNFSVFLKAGTCIQHQCKGALANTCKRGSQKKMLILRAIPPLYWPGTKRIFYLSF